MAQDHRSLTSVGTQVPMGQLRLAPGLDRLGGKTCHPGICGQPDWAGTSAFAYRPGQAVAPGWALL